MTAGGWGGYRPGAGRKPADHEPSDDQVNYERERAEHERVKREQREFALAKDRGEYLPREAQRQAAATAVAVLVQSLRALPDNLERVCGLTPEQAEQAQIQVDAALDEVAAAFKAMSGDV